ncbi:MAG: DNA replication/repair protein RecF [Thermomicrobiales bacterium]
MYLSRLHLEEFRNYHSLEMDLDPAGLRLIGPNASGKTSFMEAVVLLATTRSPRASSDREVVEWESGKNFGVSPYSRIEAEVQYGERLHKIAVSIELDPERQHLSRKTFTLDGQSVRAHDLIGVVKFVLFSPEDVQLVTGPPAERRRQLDILISQIDRNYLRSLSRFGRVLSQRNGLLKGFSRDRVSPKSTHAITQLTFWDEELVGAGAYVIASRQLMIDRLSALLRARSHRLIRDAEIDLTYQSKLDLGPISTRDNSFTLQALTEAVTTRFHDQLALVRDEEFRRGVTVVGPHRDDVVFGLNGRELAVYGSRGQQRLGVVAIKLSEGDLITGETGETPILLLDDVLSELDAAHRELLLDAVITDHRQLLVTSTEPGPLDHAALAGLPISQVTQGTIEPFSMLS